MGTYLCEIVHTADRLYCPLPFASLLHSIAAQSVAFAEDANSNPSFPADCTKLIPPLGILGTTLCTASIVERFGLLLLHASFVCFGHLQETPSAYDLLLLCVHTYYTEPAFSAVWCIHANSKPRHRMNAHIQVKTSGQPLASLKGDSRNLIEVWSIRDHT